MTCGSCPMGGWSLEAMGVMMSMAFVSGQPHLKPLVLVLPQLTLEL